MSARQVVCPTGFGAWWVLAPSGTPALTLHPLRCRRRSLEAQEEEARVRGAWCRACLVALLLIEALGVQGQPGT
jgi:hypothetical protein